MGQEGLDGAGALGRFPSGQLSCCRSPCWGSDMKWGGDKDGDLIGLSREHLPRTRGWRGLVVSLCRWGGEDLVRGLGLGQGSISLTQRAPEGVRMRGWGSTLPPGTLSYMEAGDWEPRLTGRLGIPRVLEGKDGGGCGGQSQSLAK